MTGVKRKNFTSDLSAKVALGAICDIKTVNEIGRCDWAVTTDAAM
ncbi:MAG: hypothetical protein RQ714_08215 [Nitrosomonas sp.]|nr:hypothetical protein [Nitrosomonas sp.]